MEQLPRGTRRASSVRQAIAGVHAVVIVTEWPRPARPRRCQGLHDREPARSDCGPGAGRTHDSPPAPLPPIAQEHAIDDLGDGTASPGVFDVSHRYRLCQKCVNSP